MLQEIFNNTSDITLCRPLPHYAPKDIVICLDEQNQLVPSEKLLHSFGPNEFKRVDKETEKNTKWIALVIASHNLVIRDTELPVGILAMKLRQLSIIGYTPVMVSSVKGGNKRILISLK